MSQESEAAMNKPRRIAVVTLVVAFAAAANACVLVDAKSAGHDVVVCHKGKKTMTLPREALKAHLNHGDDRGPC